MAIFGDATKFGTGAVYGGTIVRCSLDAVSSAAGVPILLRYVRGQVDGEGGTAVVPILLRYVSGQVDGVAGFTVHPLLYRSVSGQVDGVAGLTVHPLLYRSVSGQVDGVAGLVPVPILLRYVRGQVDGVSEFPAFLAHGYKHVDGAVGGQSELLGAAKAARAAIARINGIATLEADAGRIRQLLGLISGVANFSGSAKANYGAAAVLSPESTLTGKARVAYVVAGAINGVAALIVDPLLIHYVDGIIEAVSTLNGSSKCMFQGVDWPKVIGGVSGLSAAAKVIYGPKASLGARSTMKLGGGVVTNFSKVQADIELVQTYWDFDDLRSNLDLGDSGVVLIIMKKE